MIKYKIGDRVWYASRKTIVETVTCPDCFGQRALTVIKGDGEKVSIECAGCQSGYEPSKGYVTYYKQGIDVSQVSIQKVEETLTKTQYGFNGCYLSDENKLFVKKEDAEIRAAELAKEHNQDELKKINRKEQHNRTWSWNAHYHRRAIKSAEGEIIYHTSKLNVAKVKAKETKKNAS